MNEQQIIAEMKEKFPKEAQKSTKFVAKNVFDDKWRVSFLGTEDIPSWMVKVGKNGLTICS